ncbi:MAG: urease accessory protein UreF [Pseudomonadota bacterium]
MSEAALKLMTWLSPGYPVGAYTYSHGLERAIEDGDITDAATAEDWIEAVLCHGGARSDAILLCHAWRSEKARDRSKIEDLADLAEALAPSAERRLETMAQGAAFAEVTGAAWCSDPTPLPHPLAVGKAAAEHDIPLAEVLPAYLQAFAANLVSAAIRLVPFGQTDGQRIIAALMPKVLTLATELVDAPLDDIGGCAIRSDIAAMRHETQTVRLFRS